jgi:hypothetical protein
MLGVTQEYVNTGKPFRSMESRVSKVPIQAELPAHPDFHWIAFSVIAGYACKTEV